MATMVDNITDRAPVKVPPPLFFLVPFGVGVALQFAVPQAFLPTGWLQLAIGLPILGMGLAFALWTVRTLTSAGTDVVFTKSTTTVVIRGPYQLSRNPIYVGASTMFIGGAIAVNSVWPLALFPVAVLLVLFRAIRPEERYLEQKFGQGYLSYKSMVRRWL